MPYKIDCSCGKRFTKKRYTEHLKKCNRKEYIELIEPIIREFESGRTITNITTCQNIVPPVVKTDLAEK